MLSHLGIKKTEKSGFLTKHSYQLSNLALVCWNRILLFHTAQGIVQELATHCRIQPTKPILRPIQIEKIWTWKEPRAKELRPKQRLLLVWYCIIHEHRIMEITNGAGPIMHGRYEIWVALGRTRIPSTTHASYFLRNFSRAPFAVFEMILKIILHYGTRVPFNFWGNSVAGTGGHSFSFVRGRVLVIR